MRTDLFPRKGCGALAYVLGSPVSFGGPSLSAITFSGGLSGAAFGGSSTSSAAYFCRRVIRAWSDSFSFASRQRSPLRKVGFRQQAVGAVHPGL
jgi:hypothetical protein